MRGGNRAWAPSPASENPGRARTAGVVRLAGSARAAWAVGLWAALAGVALASPAPRPIRPITPRDQAAPPLVPLPASPDQAQPDQSQPNQAQAAEPEASAPAPDVALPDPTARLGPLEAMRAFRALDAWMRSGGDPALLQTDLLPRAAVASVTVRLGPDVAGSATEVALSDGARAETLARAAVAAWREATRGVASPSDRAARVSQAGLRLEIEVAQDLSPVGGAELQAGAGAWVRAGLDGLAVRSASAMTARTPAWMLRQGIAPEAALVGAVNELVDEPGVALRPATELAASGFSFYRFAPLHVANPAEGRPAVFLHRGARVVPLSDLDEAGMVALAERVAEYLLRARWPGVERNGLRGVYDPIADTYDPAVASALDQAAAAAALHAVARTPGVDAGLAARAGQAAFALLADLAVVEQGETPAWDDPTSSAAALWALASVLPPGAEFVGEPALLRERCGATLAAGFVDGGGFAPGITPAERGLVALGLVAEAELSPAGPAREAALERAERAVRAAFLDAGLDGLAAQMPWLGWAELRLARARGGSAPAGAALRELRGLLWSHQVPAAGRPRDDADLAGGVVFGRGETGRVGGVVLPSWQTLRPLSVAASMLRDPSLRGGWTEADGAAVQVVRLRGALRFVAQLSAGEACGYQFARPERARGGVRTSPVDSTMRPLASSLALLTLSETLHGLSELSAAPPAGAGGG